jgi:hypothetical protein
LQVTIRSDLYSRRAAQNSPFQKLGAARGIVKLTINKLSEQDTAVRVETSKKRGIDNHQDAEVTDLHRRWFRRLSTLHPNAIARTEPSPLFNCHGLTFASRRTKILDRRNILRILEDDAWREIEMSQSLAGDVVIYFDDEGDPNHSGIIVGDPGNSLIPRVCSK